MNRSLGSGWQEARCARALGSGEVRTSVEASTAAASIRKMGDVIGCFTFESTVASSSQGSAGLRERDDELLLFLVLGIISGLAGGDYNRASELAAEGGLRCRPRPTSTRPSRSSGTSAKASVLASKRLGGCA